jgi:hypothetical protein
MVVRIPAWPVSSFQGANREKGGKMRLTQTLYTGVTKGVQFSRSLETYIGKPLLEGRCRHDKQTYFRLDGGLTK